MSVEEEERMIPVLTVLKNGAILKNIFVINKPPDETTSEETEEILIVGRHPDCNIVLMHPSISRFHLQINSNPFSRKLFITDLSSVHGTWVSEKKVEAGYVVEVNEGDTIRLGGSTRVYRLHWIPLSFAYDSEKSFVPPMDLPIGNEEEECGQVADGDCELKNIQDLNLESERSRETQTSDLVLEDISYLFSNDDWESSLEKEVHSNSFKPECKGSSFYAGHDVNGLSDINGEIRQLLNLKTVEEDIAREEGTIWDQQQLHDQEHDPCNDFAGQEMCGSGNKDVLLVQSEDESNDAVWFDSLLSSEDGELYAASESPEEVADKQKEDKFSYEMESFEIPFPFRDHLENNDKVIAKPYHALQQASEEANQENCSRDQLAEVTPYKEKCGDCKSVNESINSSRPVGNAVSEVIVMKENQTPQHAFPPTANFEVRAEKSSGNILTRRGKRASGLELQTSWSKGNTKDKVNNKGYTKDRTVAKVLFCSSEEETITPEKENCSPNTRVEEVRLSNSYGSPSSKHIFSPNIQFGESKTFSSDKENHTPKFLQPRMLGKPTSMNLSMLGQDMKLKDKQVERLPLQSLFSNSPGKRTSDNLAPTAAIGCLFDSCSQIMQKIKSVEEAKRGWTIVADTSSLLDKESRKSLQLLQGLKLTQLIIPRMVIRELEYMHRRGSLFRRTTEASLALEWIEECMLNTRWWMLVQSSVEEGEQTVPTPPASPHSHFTESSGGFPLWTTSCASFSPTSEDHIIDYALFNRRLNNNGQLVLVSNDLSLKIKAMAVGLICETAEEFRNSLVNPFSERFMWGDSSPRGQTWSVKDDVELKDKYYRSPWKKSSKGGSTKGLKLILHHNSQYGQNSLAAGSGISF